MNLNLLRNYVVPSTMIGALSTQMYESQHLDPKMAYSLVGKRRFSKVSEVMNDPGEGENAQPECPYKLHVQIQLLNPSNPCA